ncbi:FBD-like protein [Artemisia annua]|uniref:FBD-like protein n=1 Tax=Artemisia annua TaxID=35608 RepID=A0A2U1L5I5_ARTAN|nr:FBD-like protein [Artemisia annua]
MERKTVNKVDDGDHSSLEEDADKYNEQLEAVFFKLKESKSYRRTVRSISISYITAATPLLSSLKQTAYLIDLDIVEDGIVALAEVKKSYKLETRTTEVSSTLMSYKNVDRLSNMPDEVLSEILSSMPTKFAVQTSILSKTWRYNWTMVTNVDIDVLPFHGVENCCTFVNRVLSLCKTTEIKLFRLHFNRFWVQKSRMTKWINEAVRLKVSELEVQYGDLLELPFCLFTCKTLTKLRIDNYNERDVCDSQTPFNLPCLKALDIAIYRNSSPIVFKLISGCSILETLSLQIYSLSNIEEYKFNIPTLKRLTLRLWKSRSNINKVVLNVPNLEDLFIFGGWCSLIFVMQDFPSLVSTEFSSSVLWSDHFWVELLKGLTRAKSLSLSMRYSEDLSHAPLPKFLNVKHLKLDSWQGLKWPRIFQYLESCSELEHIYIMKPEESDWSEPLSVPTWAEVRIRVFGIHVEKCRGFKEANNHLRRLVLGGRNAVEC